MSFLGSILTGAIYLDASSTTIPASSSNSAELLSSTGKESASIYISTNIASPFYITLGAAGAEENLLLVPGYASTVHEVSRMPIHISAGMRIGIRAYANSTIASGTVTINLWS